MHTFAGLFIPSAPPVSAPALPEPSAEPARSLHSAVLERLVRNDFRTLQLAGGYQLRMAPPSSRERITSVVMQLAVLSRLGRQAEREGVRIGQFDLIAAGNMDMPKNTRGSIDLGRTRRHTIGVPDVGETVGFGTLPALVRPAGLEEGAREGPISLEPASMPEGHLVVATSRGIGDSHRDLLERALRQILTTMARPAPSLPIVAFGRCSNHGLESLEARRDVGDLLGEIRWTRQPDDEPNGPPPAA